MDDLQDTLSRFLNHDGYCLYQVFVTKTQFVSPKAASRRTEDGKFISTAIEDMSPFLDREELKSNMYIPLIDED